VASPEEEVEVGLLASPLVGSRRVGQRSLGAGALGSLLVGIEPVEVVLKEETAVAAVGQIVEALVVDFECLLSLQRHPVR